MLLFQWLTSFAFAKKFRKSYSCLWRTTAASLTNKRVELIIGGSAVATRKLAMGTIMVPNDGLKNKGIIGLWVQWNYPLYQNAGNWAFSTSRFSFHHTEPSLVHFARNSPLKYNVSQIGTKSEVIQYDNSLSTPVIQLVGWKIQIAPYWVIYTRRGDRV